MFNGAMNADVRNKAEKERQSDVWRGIVNSGDIATALRASEDAEREYKRMAVVFREYAAKMHDFEMARRESVGVLKEFARNAARLMGDSMRVVLMACGDAVQPEDVNVVTDDERWCALLARIAEADTMNQVNMTFAAYKIAAASVGSFESKIAGLKAKMSLSGGATEAERGTSEKILMRVMFACEQIRKRKEVLKELNLSARAKIEKWMKSHTVGSTRSRNLTDDEKATLSGLY